MILLNFVTGKMETYDMVAKEKIDLLKKKIDEADAIVVRCIGNVCRFRIRFLLSR